MDKILACKVLKNHGLHGSLKIKVLIENWDLYWNKIIDQNNNPLAITSSKIFDSKHNYYLINIKGVNKIEDGLKFIGHEWYIKTEDLKKEEPQCFYYYKLMGLPVEDIHGNTIGVVEDIDHIGGGDVLVIKLNIEKIVYLPFDIYMFPTIEKDKIIISKEGLDYIFN